MLGSPPLKHHNLTAIDSVVREQLAKLEMLRLIRERRAKALTEFRARADRARALKPIKRA